MNEKAAEDEFMTTNEGNESRHVGFPVMLRFQRLPLPSSIAFLSLHETTSTWGKFLFHSCDDDLSLYNMEESGGSLKGFPIYRDSERSRSSDAGS
jgi:hypothetical protein